MITDEENREIEREAMKAIQEYLKNISVKVKDIFRQCIEIAVYEFDIQPTEYIRTEDFLNSVNVQIKDNWLYVFPDMNEGMGHNSVVTGEDESANIANWLENGHDDGSSVGGQYHHYEARNFLEDAQKMLEQEFPDINIKIINDEDETSFSNFTD